MLLAEFFGLSYFLSIAAFDFRNRPASKTGECLWKVFTFYVEYSNLTCCDFLKKTSTFILDIFNSDFSFSAESNQETASLPIDKSPDKCEVGRFVLRIKIENNSSVLCCFNALLVRSLCVPCAFPSIKMHKGRDHDVPHYYNLGKKCVPTYLMITSLVQ